MPRAVYPLGSVNAGVTVTVDGATNADVVPNGLVPLQSKDMKPEEPVTTEATLGVSMEHFEVTAGVVAGIEGNVCVKSVVAA
jgi:hypothetical protein